MINENCGRTAACAHHQAVQTDHDVWKDREQTTVLIFVTDWDRATATGNV